MTMITATERYRSWRPSFLLSPLLGVILVGLTSCGEQQAAQPPQGRPPTPVRVAQVTNHDVQRSVILVGTVEPWKRSVVASEVAGLVAEFPVEEGMFVKQGQVLARLRTDTLDINLESAVASHREAQVRHLQATQDLERIRVLFEKELVTKKEYDDAVAEEQVSHQRLSRLESAIRQVRDQLDKSQTLAPFDGWVTEESTEIGQWVDEGGPVVEMVDLSHVQVEVPLPERYVREIRVGDPVSAVFDSFPGFEVKGRVFSVVAQADRAARTFPVKVDLPNSDLVIKSGMVSQVTLPVGSPYHAMVIPKDALVLRGGKEFVFLVQDGAVAQVLVNSSVHLDGLVEVSGEIQEGMTVIVQGNERLLPGQRVRLLDQIEEPS